MSNMLPPPIRVPRSTVLPPPPTPVEQAADAFARARQAGVVAPPPATSLAAPPPVPATAPPLPPAVIPRSFVGISFTDGAVIADTGQRFAIMPEEMPQLLGFAFNVAIRALEGEVRSLRESLGIPDPLEVMAAQAQAQMEVADGDGTQVPEVPADQAALQFPTEPE